jgi:4-hydroxy-3-methylbut-2-enyl diphosphate reductase
MKTKITKQNATGFCYGVKRAINILEKSAAEYGSVDCLGELVHNPEVMQKLEKQGIKVIQSPGEITCSVAAISAHGVSPQVEFEMGNQKVKLIDATCPSVKKVQKAAQRLAKSGFTVVIYGDSKHAEVKGILGWANGKGVASLNAKDLFDIHGWPRKIGILSQTTQVPENYLKFVKAVIDKAMTGNSEITILETVCREVRQRQCLSQSLAEKSDLILVVGGKNSANTRRLLEICSTLTETHLIENAQEIDPAWLAGKKNIGITSGTSTSEESINQVVSRLRHFTE